MIEFRKCVWANSSKVLFPLSSVILSSGFSINHILRCYDLLKRLFYDKIGSIVDGTSWLLGTSIFYWSSTSTNDVSRSMLSTLYWDIPKRAMRANFRVHISSLQLKLRSRTANANTPSPPPKWRTVFVNFLFYYNLNNISLLVSPQIWADYNINKMWNNKYNL